MNVKGNRWVTLGIILVGFFMILIDTTIVNVSIPTLIKDLNASLTEVEWVITGFALSFAALLITFGRLGDLYGRKTLFMVGLTVFTIASFFSGEATSIGVLIAARVFQGIGGAMISPAVLSIISSTFKGRERATAFGVFGAVSGLAVAVGPILGGWLTTDYTWRWIFRVNIPIGILGLILAWLIIPESKADQGKPIDVGGMVTSTLGFLALIFGLIEGQSYGWWHPTKDFVLGSFTWGVNQPLSIIAVSFIVSAVLLAIFIFIEGIKTRRNASPAVDFSFFKHRTFRYGLIAVGIISLGEFSSLFTLPIFLQSIHGFTPLQSGYAVLPMALAILVAAPLSANLVNRLGSKGVISTGIFLEALGLLLISRLNINTTYASLIPALVVLGAGIGLALAQNTQIILSEINPHESGSASGVLNTIRQVGSALGIAVIGAVLTHQATVAIPQQIRAATIPNISDQTKQVIADKAGSSVDTTGNQQAAADLFPQPPLAVQQNPVALATFNAKALETSSAIQRAVNTGLASGIARSIEVGSAFVLVGAFLSLAIPNIRSGDHRTEEVAAH